MAAGSRFNTAVLLANGPMNTAMQSTKAVDFLKNDVDLLKVATLYGDGIQLISPSVLQWNDWLAFGNFDTANVELRNKLLRETIAHILGGRTGDDIRSGAIKIAGLDELPDPSAQGSGKFVQLASLDNRHTMTNILDTRTSLGSISALWSTMANSIQEDKLPELEQIRELVESGRLSLIHPFDSSILPPEDSGANVILDITGIKGLDARIENDLKETFARMLGALQIRIEAAWSNSELFPIFDEAAYGIAERMFQNSTGDLRKFTAPIAGKLFARLPNFQRASLKEVIEIRSELDDSVRGFQIAIAGIGAELAESPIQDLDKLAEMLWLTQVQPELEEIEYRIRKNTYMRQLLDIFLTKPDGTLNALGATTAAALGKTTSLGVPGLVVGGIIGGIPTARAALDTKKNSDAIRRSKFFFLYQLNQSRRNRRGRRR